jgi:hypothetical protein
MTHCQKVQVQRAFWKKGLTAKEVYSAYLAKFNSKKNFVPKIGVDY